MTEHARVPRGFTYCVYVDDNGGRWGVAVDSDYVDHPGRGWVRSLDNELYPLPRGWRTRRAIGLDSRGTEQSAVVGTLDAPLWVGTDPVFTFRDSEGTPQFATVIRLEAERRTIVRADPEPA
jgi:hypothetical protein